MRPEDLGDFRPAHKLVDGEEFEELGVQGDLRDAGFFVNAVEEVGLFVVVRCEDYVVDDSGNNLNILVEVGVTERQTH